MLENTRKSCIVRTRRRRLMKRITGSVYTFENMIRGHFLYVDKTEHIWKLAAPPQEMYEDNSPLPQIKEKAYFRKYLHSSKKITLAGVNFDTGKGQLINWQTEDVAAV